MTITKTAPCPDCGSTRVRRQREVIETTLSPQAGGDGTRTYDVGRSTVSCADCGTELELL